MGSGWADVLFVIGFFLVMLIVPWIMARQPSDRDSPLAGDGSAGATSGHRFSSDRERRLWLGTLAALAVIYSTMGLMPELAAILRDANLLGLSSSAVLLLVGGAIAVRWAKTRPGRHEIAAALGVAGVCLMALARTTIAERTHLFEYGLVAILIYQALTERRRNGRPVPVPWLLAVVATALLGFLDERIQSLIPSRFYDPDDVLVNGVSGAVAITSSLFLGWARRLDARRRRSREDAPHTD